MELIVKKKQNNPSEIHLKPSLFVKYFFRIINLLKKSV